MNDIDASSSEDGDEQIYHHDDDDDEGRYVPRAEQSRLMLLKLISILERKVTYPTRTIKKIDNLVDNFLENLEDDVHQMLCTTGNDESDNDDYHGLDSNIDTEAEVEAIIRIFPNVLSRRKEIMYEDFDDDDDVYADDDHHEARCFYYPIQLLAVTIHESNSPRINLVAVSFIPVVAKLAIEFGCFEEEDRGGLLCYDTHSNTNVLQSLMSSSNLFYGRDHNRLVDETFLEVLIHLKRIGLLEKEDIPRYGLVNKIYRRGDEFAEKRFRFLVQWDPTPLTHINEYRCIPLCLTAMHSMQAFRVTFEAGIRYFPKKKGISVLFYKDDIMDETPFQDACNDHGREKVVKVIEDTLTYYHSDTPLNIADTLLSAAIDDDIHLDCVYFLLRRQPDILQKMLSAKEETGEATATAEDNNSKVIRKRKRKS